MYIYKSLHVHSLLDALWFRLILRCLVMLLIVIEISKKKIFCSFIKTNECCYRRLTFLIFLMILSTMLETSFLRRKKTQQKAYRLTSRISSCISCKYSFLLLLMDQNIGQTSVIFSKNSTKIMNLKIKNRYHQMFRDLNEHLLANYILRFHLEFVQQC